MLLIAAGNNINIPITALAVKPVLHARPELFSLMLKAAVKSIDLRGQIGYTGNVLNSWFSGFSYDSRPSDDHICHVSRHGRGCDTAICDHRPQELSERLHRTEKPWGVAQKAFIFASNFWRGESLGTLRQFQTRLD